LRESTSFDTESVDVKAYLDVRLIPPRSRAQSSCLNPWTALSQVYGLCIALSQNGDSLLSMRTFRREQVGRCLLGSLLMHNVESANSGLTRLRRDFDLHLAAGFPYLRGLC